MTSKRVLGCLGVVSVLMLVMAVISMIENRRRAELNDLRAKQGYGPVEDAHESSSSGNGLELVDFSGTTNDYGTTITGRIRNNTGHHYDYVQVTFNLYDSSNARVGTAMDNLNSLASGEVWKFKAFGASRSVTFKLDSISGH